MWFLFFWMAMVASSQWAPGGLRRPLAVLFPLLAVLAAWAAPTPLERLFCSTAWLLYALKATILLSRPARPMDWCGRMLYFTLWPGMDPLPLERRDPEIGLPGQWFIQGWITMVAGGVALLALPLLNVRSTWPVLACILCIVHLGYSDVLSALVRWAGFPVRRLFDNPLAATSLRDFWSRRWNRPFVEMNQVLFVPLLSRGLGRRQAIMGAFLISGGLHELAISLPPGRGWGGPLIYFGLQAWGMGRLPQGRLWTWLWLLGPLPLLFHEPFRVATVGVLLDCLYQMPWLSSPRNCLSGLLWLAGWGHFLVLAASFQVPHRLGWREELSRLRPLNRKLLWVYGGFIVGMITSFGWLILRLHDNMLAGETGAVHLLGLTAVFWTARLVVDAIVFEHSDWPEGPEFTIGHTLLTSLFIYLATTCWLVVLFGNKV